MRYPGRNLLPMALSPPRSLSPSKVSSFTGCPLAFRFTIIDRLPEPPSPQAVKGTLVHAALEGLFWHHPAGRRDRAAALGELESAWVRLRATDPEFAALDLSEEEAEAFLSDAALLVDNYFQLEDPDRVHAVGVELGLEADVGRLRLRGIIDRLDLTDDGELVVVDYKTGRAPSLRFERTKLAGVHTYALLCERVLGRPPAEVRLLYLRDPVALTAVPNQQSLLGQERRTLAVWSAIERACDREDFQPRPSPLCGYCNFQSLCPAFADRVPAGQVAS
jgi:putative RecB family exonuclease